MNPYTDDMSRFLEMTHMHAVLVMEALDKVVRQQRQLIERLADARQLHLARCEQTIVINGDPDHNNCKLH